MLPILLLSGVLLGVVIGVFWNEIKSFLTKSWEKIKTIVIPAAIAGFKTYLQTGKIALSLYDAAQVAIHMKNTLKYRKDNK